MDLTERFEKHRPENYGPNNTMESLVKNGQKPEVLIITCMDSRISVFNLFGLDTGEAVVLRSAGPIIPEYDLDNAASQLLHENLSLAINDLGVGSLALLGHSKCGVASKLANNLYAPGDIPCLKKTAGHVLQNALNESGDKGEQKLIEAIEHQIIIQGMKNLFDYPVVVKAITENRLTVEGMQFEMETGRLLKLNSDGKAFRFDIVAGPARGSLACDCEHQSSKKAANA